MEIFIPEFTPMYTTVWTFVADCIKDQRAGSSRGSSVISNPTAYTIVSSRLGVVKTAHEAQWHHICRPRVLAKAIKLGNHSFVSDPWLELNWTLAHFNQFQSDKPVKCWGCRYYLTKSEIMLVKAGILSMRV